VKLTILSLIIAAYAAVVATLTLYTQRRDKQSRLKVTVYTGIMGLGPGVASDPCLFLAASNPGHKMVVVTMMGLVLPDGRDMSLPYPQSHVNFPYKLEPEDKCVVWMDLKKLANQLRGEGFTGVIKIVGFYNDAVGRRHLSKKPFKFNLNGWS